MMKKGYTLVELLAVLVILGIILSIVSLNVLKIFNDRKQRDYDNIVMLIEENTKVLLNTDTKISVEVNDKLQEIENSGSEVISCNLSYNELVKSGLMDADTKNPITGKVINSKSYIKITLTEDYDYNYEFVYVDEGANFTNNCLSE